MIQPSQYSQTPISTLLAEAGQGRIGFDQRLYDAILARPDEAAPAVLAYGEAPPEEARIALDEDLLNLLAKLPAANALPYVTRILREGYSDLPESLVSIVRRIGPPAVEPLIEIYHALDEEVAGEVAFLLAGSGVKDPKILALCTERLEFDMEDGAMLLGLYGDPAAIPALEKMLAEVGQNRELDFAIETLKHPQAAPPELDFDPREDYPELAAPDFDVLADEEIVELAHQHEDEGVRLAALDILEDLDLSAEQAGPLLALAQSPSESPALRAAAWRALHRLQQIAEVEAAAQAALHDESLPASIRVAALITLLPKFPLADLKQRVEAFLADPASRADAVQAMWRSRQPVYASSFGQFLDDPQTEVRRQAARGAGVMGDKTSIAKLRQLFSDEEVRKDALFAYAMAVPSDTSSSRMRSLLKRIDEEAGGLSPAEVSNVQLALDMRLESAGKAPIFFVDDEEDEEGHVHGPNCGHSHH